MKQHLFKLLKFLGVSDRSNNLSISNIAVIIIVTKIAISPELGITELGALLVTLLNYAHKRFESNKVTKVAEAPLVDLKPITEQIKAIDDKMATMVKDIDEAKDKASKAALAVGLKTTQHRG